MPRGETIYTLEEADGTGNIYASPSAVEQELLKEGLNVQGFKGP
jgi:hypothetical protein